MTLKQINENLLTVCSYKFLDRINIKFNKEINSPNKDINKLLKNDESLVIEYLSCIDKESLSINNENKEYIFSAACLLSELYHEKFDNINSYIRTIFLRLGLAPSALTLQNQKEKFDELPSVFDELQLGNIIEEKYRTDIAEKTYYLTQEQKQIWHQLIGDQKEVLISAPTSSGKSFLLAEYIVEQYNKSQKFQALYIVPTLSLINQVKRDLSVLNQGMNIKTHIPDSINENKIVLILTQDKAISLTTFPQELKWDCIVFDEVHNIFQNFSTPEEDNDDDSSKESFSNSKEVTQNKLDERSLIYRFLIERFVEQKNYNKMILSGPNIEKGISNIIQTYLPDNSTRSAIKSSPVLKILFSFKDTGKKSILNSSLLLENELHISIHLSKKLRIFSSDSIRTNDTSLIRNDLLCNDPQSTILSLSPSPPTATTVIRRHKQENNPSKDNNIIALKKYLCDLLGCAEEHLPEFGFDLDNGNVVHHGSLPSHIRLCIEIAAKEGIISHLSTTATLLQGMNFPIKYLIASDAGNISTKRKSEKLPNTRRQPYSIPQFKNILGRSGRLMKDLVGYGIILDENQTKEDLEIENELGEGLQTDNSSQELNDLREEQKESIQCAANNEQISLQDFPPKVKQKAILIRRYVLNNTDFSKCQQLLKKRGIDISKEQHEQILQILPKKHYIVDLINKQYHLFDPLDMVRMIDIYESTLRPLNTDILSIRELMKQIWEIISTDESFKNSLDHKFNDLLNDDPRTKGKLKNIINIAYDWVFGKSWSEIWKNSLGRFQIIKKEDGKEAKEWKSISVTDFIKNEQSKKEDDKNYTPKKIATEMKEFSDKMNLVSFHLPKLLKPWLDIDDYYKKQKDLSYKGSPILSALEHGLTNSNHMKLLEQGWHREIILGNNKDLWVQIQKDFLDGKDLNPYFNK